ncbi:hypothetical protein [Sphingomonas bacterium]|uniref:hypothetical protein n=1 Tax=Sphingomonas bacterium TaxID=1895847 RepID=UPI0034A00820
MKPVTSDTSNRAFYREVDEEVRRERMADIWSRHGVAIVAGVLALLLAIGLGLWWRGHREARRGVEGERLQAAFDRLGAGDAKAAGAALTPIARDAGPGYRALARMTEADIALSRRDNAAAARLFASIADDDGVAAPLRDLALVRRTSAEFDTLKPDAVVSRLRSLAMKGSPWFGSAGELVALSYVRMNKRDLAAALFGQIAGDDGAPATLRQRAAQMASALGADAAPQPGGAAVAPQLNDAAVAPQGRGAAAAPQGQDKPAT